MAYFDASKYVDVQERIVRFWTTHPTGAIVTKLMSPPDDFEACRYEASVYKDINDIRPAATGYAYELRLHEGKGVNVTSHEENCETSAIGRALANMGYATTRENRPSAQEIDKVNRTLAATEDGNLPPRTRTTTVNAIPATDDAPADGNAATERQVKAIFAIARSQGLSADEVKADVTKRYGRGIDAISRHDASAFIEWLNSRQAVAS